MNKNMLISAILSMSSVLGFGQNSSQAKNILDKACALYEKSKGVSFSFKMTSTDAKGNSYRPQSGKAFAKGNKFRLDTDESTVWFDGKTQWVLMKELKEVNVSNPTSDEIASMSPLALLNTYKSGYMLSAPTVRTIGGKSADAITLTPNGSKGDFREISIAIDKSSGAVLQIVFTFKNGSGTKIDISAYNTNYNFPDTDFVFDKKNHKEVEIVDLR